MLAEKRFGADLMGHDQSEASVLLARIATEIVACADLTSALQDEMGMDRADLSAHEIMSMQKLDLVDQTLRNLATILTSTSQEVGAMHVDLARVLRECTLSALASRLGGTEATAPDDDFDLF